MFFRLQYAHFRPLICVTIKFSRGHVYYLYRILQGACLFRPARLFRTLEYSKDQGLEAVLLYQSDLIHIGFI